MPLNPGDRLGPYIAKLLDFGLSAMRGATDAGLADRGMNRISPHGGFDPAGAAMSESCFYVSQTGDPMVAPFPKGDLAPGRITPLFSTGI